MKNLDAGKKAIGFIIKTCLLILLALITCTCSGLRLTLVPLNIEKPIDYFLYSGKLVKPIKDVMVCATSKTDGLVFHSWHQQKPLTWLPYHPTQGLVYYQNPVVTPKKCLPIKLYQYPSTTRSFSNQYKTVWIGQNRSLHTGFQPQSLRVNQSNQGSSVKSYRD